MDSQLDSHTINNVLLIAFHYPPVKVSSGVQRTLAFSRYLPENQWQPWVLTAHPRAYPSISDDQIGDIPEGVVVKRAFALDSARHLSCRGRYLDILALPDRWISWWMAGVIGGLRTIRQNKVSLIWSTYPITTAHLIALVLQRVTGLPWVADFRDAMVDDVYPAPGIRRRCHAWIEKKTVEACAAAVFTSPGAIALYRQRYPTMAENKWHLIPNGYNEEIFAEVEADMKPEAGKAGRALRLIHSGVLYPSERDPKPFFEAIAELKVQGLLSVERIRIILRATEHDELYQPLIDALCINDIVALEPGISYREALSEMLNADGLLIFQAANCNHQIPAKLYEYFRAKRPIFALTDSHGDTASALRAAGIDTCVALDNKEAIKVGLLSFISALEQGTGAVVSQTDANYYSRRAFTKNLGALFNQVIAAAK
ncbi:glycosyltransferase [Neptunomonas antarctica]|uniref:Glycosyltransferase involved in cell wall bisynthesis n=1 Tax=Neptunomonas antarctica TaxID=619304 RepID=A0A1N7JEY3_9GAMM|nr:glycosyltransferase [Neptunomonas antarctica]SIS47860.1 Glycosyltransferase involved in cell wall bisynthesis [Neptunomonas antarctica]